MGAVILITSGNITSTTSEVAIFDRTTIPGTHKFCIDTVNLAGGDTVVLRIYKKINGTLSKINETTLTGVQTVSGKEFDGLTFHHGAAELKVTIQKTGGTNRAYDWQLELY